MFKVGDYIRGLKDNEYSVTNERMLLGVVIEVSDEDAGEIVVKVLKHENEIYISNTYPVYSDGFCKVNERK